MKSAYNKVNGFRGLGPTDVEDLALLRRFQKLGLKTFQLMGLQVLPIQKAQKGYASVLTQRVDDEWGFHSSLVFSYPCFFC